MDPIKAKEQILKERADYYKENYKTKIAVQRQAKETCECGIILSNYGMTRHKKSVRHTSRMAKLEEEASKTEKEIEEIEEGVEPEIVIEESKHKTCECGMIVLKKSMTKHLVSKRHQSRMEEIANSSKIEAT